MGNRIAYSKKDQRKYVINLIKETEEVGGKPSKMLAFSMSVKFQNLVEQLIYLTISRHDISNDVSSISQFIQTPNLSIWMQ